MQASVPEFRLAGPANTRPVLCRLPGSLAGRGAHKTGRPRRVAFWLVALILTVTVLGTTLGTATAVLTELVPASPYALMWQWSGGGGATNGIGGFNGDLDTIDAIRQN
jgi:hypothetical protein